MIGYILIPMGLSDEQEHIYIKLYKKCDFKTMHVNYTIQQLVNDSNPKLKLTTQKIRTIIKFLLEKGYLVEIEKGFKGKPTTYRIVKIIDLNQQQINNNATLNCIKANNNDVVIEPLVEDNQQQCVSELTVTQQQFHNPIKDTKIKEHSSVIFDRYPRKENKEYSLKLISKAISKIGIEQLEKSLENYISKINRENIQEQYVKSSVTFFGGGYEQYLNSNIKTDWEKFMEKENERRFY